MAKASSFSLFLFPLVILFLFPLSLSHTLSPLTLYFPIRKNPQSLQYYTTIVVGPAKFTANVAIDLGNDGLWFDCYGYNSSSYRPIPCGSPRCNSAEESQCTDCSESPLSKCATNTCGVGIHNQFLYKISFSELGEDTMVVSSADGRFINTGYDSPNFVFSCANSFLMDGQTRGIDGVVGLGIGSISLHTQLSSFFKLPHKFSLCLPSEGLGELLIGGRPAPYSLTTTPLIRNQPSTDTTYDDGDPSLKYYIDVKSIKIDGEPVSFDTSLLLIDEEGVGGTRFSTVNPYTLLHTSIYQPFVAHFVKAAAAKKIKRVKPVQPFGACFKSKSIKQSDSTGPLVPIIDLVLAEGSSVWRIYGANSMVKATKHVLCLGFVDGGPMPRSILIGGKQLENNHLEFDLRSSKLGFSSSLGLFNTSCSHYKLH